MNYSKHYTLLINRAQVRILHDYTEKHHIIPKCMGGNNKKENIVSLTPEEHYVAHQLLIKIYPENHSLKKAALMMCVKSGNQKRNNKAYGWIKRNARPAGEANGMFGRTHTPEVCDKLRTLDKERFTGKSYEDLYGKEKSDSLKSIRAAKQSAYRKKNPLAGKDNPNAKSFEITDPSGIKHIITGGLVKFCKSNNLWISKMIDVSKGRIPEYKGWKIFYL